MIDLLIDRVGNVNIFNILNSGQYHSESHIQSVMDTDLISEYIREIESLSKLSNNFFTNPNTNHQIKPDILKELKVLGETFYDQFFPSEISEKLKVSNEKFLHFNIDSGLGDIPWELLYDGDCFLADKYYIGRTIKGAKSYPVTDDTPLKLKMLIIADPNEDLEWAQKEGEILFKVLRDKVPSSLLELEFIAGKQITKLKLLSLIRGKNIIHYAGHLHFSSDPMENGWLLSNDKVLKAREIKNSAFNTNLVFSNSCNSSSKASQKLASGIMNYFAGSFLMSGIMNFVGTKWELADNDKTIDFTIRFYLNLFNDKSIGESLFLAREFARQNYDPMDITWANYSLHGNPNRIIIKRNHNSKNKIIDPVQIRKNYPTPIAASYIRFLEEDKKENLKNKMNSLIDSFEEFSKLMGAIVLSDYRNKSLNTNLPIDSQITVTKWWDMIFRCMLDLKKLQLAMVVETLMMVLFSNKELIYKITDWITKFRNGQLDEDSLEGYLITFQYYYENLLVELSELEKCHIFYISQHSGRHVLFCGVDKKVTEIDTSVYGYFATQVDEYRGKVVLVNRNKKSVLVLQGIKVRNSGVDDMNISLEFNAAVPGNSILSE